MAKPNEEKVQELLKMLEDPDIGSPVKAAIRQSMMDLASGGFEKAYNTSLSFLSRSNLDAFSEYVFEKKPYDHHKEITKVLQADESRRELIIIGPGNGKSTYVSVQYPAWHMGKNPNDNIILISATADQAEKLCVAVRQTVDSHPKYKEVFPGIAKDEDRGWTRSTLFLKNNTQIDDPNPNMFATGMSGPVIGRRANVIIVDDPTKQEDAGSAKKMEDQKYWFKETLASRFHPGVPEKFFVILTRWHDKDLASMLVEDLRFNVTLMPSIGDEKHGAYVDYINPDPKYMEVNDDDFLLQKVEKIKREEGLHAEIAYNEGHSRFCVRKFLHKDGNRAIWPSHQPMSQLEDIRRENGSVRFNLVYQGNPSGLQGDVFKREWLRYYGPGEPTEGLPDGCMFFQAVDVAVSKKDSADYFVIMTVALDQLGNIYIVDIYRDRIEAPQQPKTIAFKYREYPKTTWVLIETTAYQLSLFQTVMSESQIPAKQYKPIKDKIARASSAAARVEGGKVFINKLAPWRREFEDELTSFPRGEHDDQVDAFSSLLEELSLRSSKPIVLQIGFNS